MDSVVNGYRDQLVQLAEARHWDVREESSATAIDARLVIRQGVAQCPVLLYHTGKIVVQGKASPLHDALETIRLRLEAGELVGDSVALSDATQAIAELQDLSHYIPSLDPVVSRFTQEAALTFEHQAFLATAFLLGAASELIITKLIHVFANTLSEGDRAQYQKKLNKEHGIAGRWEVFHDAWKRSPIRLSASHDLDAEVAQTFQFTRICRNEAGHPILPPRFDSALLQANLAYFRRYLETIQELISHCQAVGIT